uniref:Uncharacterized protein n=1 Tax=Utricularia reniformis TaxID=192314 RepID=A0A1Y0B2Y5_9LAMI|nr:hypothetical protein AEK19_MT1567 [Utricularia reniformis]ART31754.1 hypothetical protein AEK19_MT1567 [Utricularia reniformis]
MPEHPQSAVNIVESFRPEIEHLKSIGLKKRIADRALWYWYAANQ